MINEEISDKAGSIAAIFLVIVFLLFLAEAALFSLTNNPIFAIAGVISLMMDFALGGALMPKPVLVLCVILGIIFSLLLVPIFALLVILVGVTAYLLRQALEWATTTKRGDNFAKTADRIGNGLESYCWRQVDKLTMFIVSKRKQRND